MGVNDKVFMTGQENGDRQGKDQEIAEQFYTQHTEDPLITKQNEKETRPLSDVSTTSMNIH